ncbi:DNA cross-link repair 1A protein [Tetrabaena socialis]|uniref:DNA cross-link repair 1A protein n=1 Tax=Tetrabaena socialis TaxID=47790 RepID=A0A2J8A478_9CHLO|nr:DNA cross-link repair 1A protein [Tetrabaena socialis]|eukprot:PNH07331.1 DNA cross-link repair 1A protein [Tetrabaena socialis]
MSDLSDDADDFVPIVPSKRQRVAPLQARKASRRAAPVAAARVVQGAMSTASVAVQRAAPRAPLSSLLANSLTPAPASASVAAAAKYSTGKASTASAPGASGTPGAGAAWWQPPRPQPPASHTPQLRPHGHAPTPQPQPLPLPLASAPPSPGCCCPVCGCSLLLLADTATGREAHVNACLDAATGGAGGRCEGGSISGGRHVGEGDCGMWENGDEEGDEEGDDDDVELVEAPLSARLAGGAGPAGRPAGAAAAAGCLRRVSALGGRHHPPAPSAIVHLLPPSGPAASGPWRQQPLQLQQQQQRRSGQGVQCPGPNVQLSTPAVGLPSDALGAYEEAGHGGGGVLYGEAGEGSYGEVEGESGGWVEGAGSEQQQEWGPEAGGQAQGVEDAGGAEDEVEGAGYEWGEEVAEPGDGGGAEDAEAECDPVAACPLPARTCAPQVVPLFKVTLDGLSAILGQYKGRYNAVIGFSPTGWNHTAGGARGGGGGRGGGAGRGGGGRGGAGGGGASASLTRQQQAAPIGRRVARGTVVLYQVPYSEHSSFSEMRDFVHWLQPGRIVPSVNSDGPGGARTRAMLQLLQGGPGGGGDGAGAQQAAAAGAPDIRRFMRPPAPGGAAAGAGAGTGGRAAAAHGGDTWTALIALRAVCSAATWLSRKDTKGPACAGGKGINKSESCCCDARATPGDAAEETRRDDRLPANRNSDNNCAPGARPGGDIEWLAKRLRQCRSYGVLGLAFMLLTAHQAAAQSTTPMPGSGAAGNADMAIWRSVGDSLATVIASTVSNMTRPVRSSMAQSAGDFLSTLGGGAAGSNGGPLSEALGGLGGDALLSGVSDSELLAAFDKLKATASGLGMALPESSLGNWAGLLDALGSASGGSLPDLFAAVLPVLLAVGGSDAAGIRDLPASLRIADSTFRNLALDATSAGPTLMVSATVTGLYLAAFIVVMLAGQLALAGASVNLGRVLDSLDLSATQSNAYLQGFEQVAIDSQKYLLPSSLGPYQVNMLDLAINVLQRSTAVAAAAATIQQWQG